VNKEDFQELLWQKGRELHRTMPWREDTRPYYVLVSELMLQQTQVDRVTPKFLAFIDRFPDEATLASASLAEVVALWNGLGYNRRAKYLHDSAKMIVTEYDGEFPDTYDQLIRLPGVGPNTAGAILAYAFNQPVVFIETNVRTVYFEHFFANHDSVSDNQLREAVATTLDLEHPREFYQALMDYGTWLKRQGAGRLSKSKHYKKQSPLKGSVREVRGQVIRYLSEAAMTVDELEKCFIDDARLAVALAGLRRDGLIEQTGRRLHLTK
jgi:A/G-specific adenine glycosylase